MSNKTLDKTIDTAHLSVSDSKITSIYYSRDTNFNFPWIIQFPKID